MLFDIFMLILFVAACVGAVAGAIRLGFLKDSNDNLIPDVLENPVRNALGTDEEEPVNENSQHSWPADGEALPEVGGEELESSDNPDLT